MNPETSRTICPAPQIVQTLRQSDGDNRRWRLGNKYKDRNADDYGWII